MPVMDVHFFYVSMKLISILFVIVRYLCTYIPLIQKSLTQFIFHISVSNRNGLSRRGKMCQNN